jgi:hypothetical protein
MVMWFYMDTRDSAPGNWNDQTIDHRLSKSQAISVIESTRIFPQIMYIFKNSVATC